jgi:palmitoyltransferase ZDHHC9/14/18
MDSKKNYGNNYSITIFKRKYIIGNTMNLNLVIIMTFIYTAILVLWIILLQKLYPLYIFITGIFLYLLLLYYYLKSFFTEPGIIPRSHHKYILNANSNKSIKNSNKESDLFSFQENSTKSEFALQNNNPTVLTTINDVLEENIEEKEKNNKVFPDFMLADNSEVLNKKPLNNSIIISSSDSILGKSIIDINNNSILKNQKYSKKQNSSVINDNNYVPHIFQERPCLTCNIVRPPKTSHCVICDNCIMNLDHHCFYISNCVGERNRKYFILFLIYGFFVSLFCIATSSYHVLFTFVIQKKYKYLTLLLFKKYYIQIIVSFIFMLSGVVILLVKKESIKLSCSIFIPGNILFNVYFFYNIKKNKTQTKKLYDLFNIEYHPFSICIIYAVLPLFLFVSKYLKKQIKLVGKDLTTKQFVSIKEERNSNKKNKEIYNYLDSILRRKVNFKKVIKFLFSKNKESLINTWNDKTIKMKMND